MAVVAARLLAKSEFVMEEDFAVDPLVFKDSVLVMVGPVV